MSAKQVDVVIKAPKFETAEFNIRGTAPYVQNRFSNKAIEAMKAKQEAGSTGKKGKARDGKDFTACYEGAKHLSTDGWNGIPAGAFRAAMISACRLVGFKMTLAKLSLFIEADGVDAVDGTPLVKILGEPHRVDHPVRNESGVMDIRPRPMWDAGWASKLVIRWDADQFTIQDVTNLLLRVGRQIGIGEGRPDSRNSAGLGWGLFDLAD